MRFLKSTRVVKVIILFLFLIPVFSYDPFLEFPIIFLSEPCPSSLNFESQGLISEHFHTNITSRIFSSVQPNKFHISVTHLDLWTFIESDRLRRTLPTPTILECTCSDSVVTMIQNDMRVFPVVSNRHNRHFFWDHDMTY